MANYAITNHICINLERIDRTFYLNRLLDSNTISEFEFFLRSNRRKIDLSPETEVLFLDSIGSKNSLKFIGNGIVTSYNVIESSTADFEWKEQVAKFLIEPDNAKRRYLHQFKVTFKELHSDDPEDFLVEKFAYSLPFITNYNYPDRHFGKIRKIVKEDYDNILNNTIFIARTTFGKVINALPIENRMALVLKLRKMYGLQDRNISDYEEALKVLHNFITRELYSTGQLIVESHGLAKQLQTTGLPSESVGFSDLPSNHNYNKFTQGINPQRENLEVQSDRFESLFEFDIDGKFWNNIFYAITTSYQSEIEYNKRFKGKTWPIDGL